MVRHPAGRSPVGIRNRRPHHRVESGVLTNSFVVSFSTLRANPLRTFLSTLGIVIGVASLVAVLSLGDGM